LDTKGREVDYLSRKIEKEGCRAIVVDVGVLGEPLAEANYSRKDVSGRGGKNLTDLIESSEKGSDRAAATSVMIRGAINIVQDLYSRGSLDGIIGLGGSTGTTIGISAMKALPIGIPKLMVTSHMSHSRQVGEKDITVMQTPADIMGLNRIMKRSLSQAAGAIVGMVKKDDEALGSNPMSMVGITALGVTTPAVIQIMSRLQKSGYEVIVFHNRTSILEELIEAGQIGGVIDLSPGELVWAYVAGFSPERKSRLDIVRDFLIPVIIVPGSLDMIILSYPEEHVFHRYADRLTSKHGPHVTLVRTNRAEIKRLGQVIAEKANAAKGPTAILIPLKGFSSVDKEGQPFYNPPLIEEFVESVKANARRNVQVIEVESHINEARFAQEVCNIFSTMKEVVK